jgi:hypothetical protein
MQQIGQRTPRRRFRFLRRIPNWQDHFEQVHDANYTLGRLQLACDEPDKANLPCGKCTQGQSRRQLTPTRRRERTSSGV